MLRSFKLKIVLLSVLISGIILLAFGFLFLSALRRIGIERIDRELQALGDAQIRKPQPPDHWTRFESALATIRSETKPGQFVIKVNDRRDRSLYVSPLWPVGLTATHLGIPETTSDSGAPETRPPPRERDFDSPPPPSDGRPDSLRPPPRDEGRRPGDRPPPQMHPTTPRFMTLAAANRTWRFAVMGNEEVTLVIGMDLADFHAEVRRLRNVVASAAPIALLLLAVGGWFLAGQALRPVRVLTRIAGGITARGLDQRVPVGGADHEFKALIDVINGMLDRLERSFQQATRFSADAAHELKTPLTILQGQLQQALQEAPADSAEQRRYAELIEEVQRLKVIVRKLLLLAQADSGEMRLTVERVNLSEELEALYEDAQQMGAGLSITREIEPGAFVMADPDLLRQAVQNLVSNAIKYNREGGNVDLRLERMGQEVRVTVSNSANPNARLEPEHLFERFYRGDKARSRHIDGVGLGLSLSREIARSHGGDVTLAANDEQVVRFALTIPVSANTVSCK